MAQTNNDKAMELLLAELLEKAEVQGYLLTDEILETIPDGAELADRLEEIVLHFQDAGIDVYDAKAAVRWIRANAPRYGFDPGRIAAWGGSAGGYQASMLGVSAGITELEDLSLGNHDQPCDVQAVVSWFGPTDFLKMDEQLAASGFLPPAGQRHNDADSPESLLLGGKITEIPERVRAANPETYVRPDAPPFLLQHGTYDVVVPVQQSMMLFQKLEEIAGAERCELDVLENAGHGDPLFETDDNMDRVFQFLDRYLK